ncbi:EboA domain-containing protein [Croceivirga thetidis]|uniref:ERAP1-like C-terminal domain-containing protein n=1 Tax=Croceivirga thetidis TaxID=2721623 RepID=A0ABX1GPT4_9FLAO|nr:EboA domain-containing protein [Croceivirga thetidis]NKI31927.1 hypothetical protein [Croceivirga thetidis]
MFDNLEVDLEGLLKKNLVKSEFDWIAKAINETIDSASSRKLYLNYSLCNSKIEDEELSEFKSIPSHLGQYLSLKKASGRELSRIWLLREVLENDESFVDAVKKLIEISDTAELETFLKYLTLLPNPQNYQFAAVEALRTNIATVFDAISQYNPYPVKFFTDQQWNQMFLKAAFMQQDLGAIANIDERANADLARIISDYAHERWAASRTIDPLFWRPVSNFLTGTLVNDIKRLFSSENPRENKAAALVCFNSKLTVAEDLLKEYPKLREEIKEGSLTWQTL